MSYLALSHGYPSPAVPPRCEQPGSDNRPHTSDSTQEHCIPNQPQSSLPITPPTSTFTSKLPFSAFSSNVTIANDSSAQNTVPGLLKPRSKLHIGAFNVRTLCQIGQQASLARTLESRTIDVCCVSETRIQDPSVVIHLTSPRQHGEPTRYTLRVSGDLPASSRGLAGVGIALSMRAEQALLEWIPVNSRLCPVRLNGSVRTRKDRDTRRCLFVVSAYALTDCSSDEVKDEFYRKLNVQT
ncbi:unnamed protein product [Schistosoma curassoni]|uniref:Endonuclease/exonuclease/phosphatase domain-containing protein n=1 Tax=Schistosoma curassoni TaxID=6186 RepID=A0A183K641_9TREM|nr:unnamed protein product [Schistosoma curassoni]